MKRISSFAADFLLIWMKQRLIWFSLQRNGTRHWFSNIKENFTENLQLQMSVLHQSISIFHVCVYVCVCVCVCVCWILFICKGSTSYMESINPSGSSKKNIWWHGTQKLPKNLNIYLCNYQPNRNSYFSSYKAWNSNYGGMQLFKFFHIENTSKQQKMVALVRNCFVKMTLSLF